MHAYFCVRTSWMVPGKKEAGQENIIRSTLEIGILYEMFLWWSQYCHNSVIHPAGNYIFKVNNINTRIRFEICSKLIIKTPERRQWASFWCLYF